jgi:hypothetical protein
MAEQFDEEQLKALIAEEIASAEGYADTELTPDREKAIQYYNGKVPDVPAMPGRSAYISRDVANVVGWMLPDLMRVFSASDRIVDCLPETEEDEATADQAADYINFCFWRDNPGYQVMRDATWDSLVNKDGIVKQYWDIHEEVKYSTYTGLTEDQIAVILSDDNSDEVDETSSYYCRLEIAEKSKPYTVSVPVIVEAPPMQMPEEPGLVDLQSNDHMPQMQEEQAPMPVPVPAPAPMVATQDETLFDVRIKRTTKKGRLAYRTVAPENFLTDPNAIDLIDNWRFQGEKCVDVTRSDLIKMGFERDRVDAIPAFNVSNASTEDLARRNLISGQYDTPETAMERVDLYECYIKVDINDDGIAEVVKVMYAGNSGGAEILSWEEWDDETPYDKIPCNPVPHRLSSDSIADEAIDIQKFKTVVGRQMFDNVYQSNTPQPVVLNGKVKNMDAVVNRQIGVPIIVEGDVNTAIRWDITPFIGDKALLMMQHLDDTLEMRTGVSRAAMSLDPQVLQNQTATASNNGRDQRRSQVELIARDQAELGWKPVFRKSLRIMVKNQDRPRTIKLREKWVDMDPRQWNVGMDIEVNIGLGTGSRDRDMAILTNILNSQIADMDRLQASGFIDDAIDMVPKIIKTQIKIAEAAGIKSPETFYPEIPPERLEQMKQQAKELAAQGTPEQQAAQAKLQSDMQAKQLDLQLKEQQGQIDAQLQQQKTQADLQMKQMEIQANMQLERERMAQEAQMRQAQITQEINLKREQMAAELNLKRELAMMGYGAQSASVGTVQVGGNPG